MESSPYTVEQYNEIATKALATVKELLADADGWDLRKEEEGSRLYERDYLDEPIKAFKIEGTLARTPKECADKLWAFGENEWKAMDSDVELFSVLEEAENFRVVTQVNRLPWPIWSREAVALWYSFPSSEGNEYYFVSTSIEHPKAPENPKLYVRAKLSFGLYAFLPEGEGTKVVRLVHINPNGSLPPQIVNFTADKLLSIVRQLEGVFASSS